MITDAFTLYKKVAILFFITFLFNHTAYSQCANPTPTGSGAQSFCIADSPDIGDLIATGGTIVWFDAPTNGNQYVASAPLENGITYYADDIIFNAGGSCSPTRLAVTATLSGDYPGDMDVFVGKCASTSPTIGDLSATGTNIEWYDAEMAGTQLNLSDLLTDGTIYWAQQTENGCTSLRFPTIVTIVDPAPPTVAPTQSFCSPPGVTVADLQGVGSNILWYEDATGGIALDPATPLIHGEDYWGAQSSLAFPCESTIRAQTTVQIDQMPIAGTNGSYAVCEIDAVTTNLFSLLGGAPEINGTWTGPSTLTGGHLGTYDPAVNTIGDYVYTVNSPLGICPNATATVSVVVTIIPPPTVAETAQAFCEIEGATVAQLAATGASLLWYDTETDTTPLANTDLLIEGQDYWASQTEATSGCQSASRVVVNVTIIVIPPPTIADVTTTFCEIDGAIVADLSSDPNITWYDTINGTTPLATTVALVDGQQYWSSMTEPTSACESATRLAVTVTITVIPPPSITDVTISFCEIDGATVADLSSDPNISWYDTIDGITPLASTVALVNGQQYWSSMTEPTSACESATRLEVTVTIIVIPPPTTADVTTTFCEIDAATVADLSSDPNITWYDAIDGTTPVATTIALADGQQYWSSITEPTSACESASRLAVTITIIVIPPPTITDVTVTFCEIDAATVADLSTDPNITWYDTINGTTPLAATVALVDGQQYWSSLTEPTSACESATRLEVTVTIIVIPPPSITDVTTTFCEIDAATVAELSSDPNITWYDTINGTTPLATTVALVDGQQYWSSITEPTSACESATRLEVTVTITVIPPPAITDVTATFCEIDAATVAELSSDPNISWYDTIDGTTPLATTLALVDGQQYWSSITEPTSACESATRLEVTVTIIVIPPPSLTDVTTTFCEIDGATVAELSSDPNISWYGTIDGTTPLVTTVALVDGQQYWSSLTEPTSACQSATRLEVTVTITVILPPTTADVTTTFCEIDAATVADLSADTNITWYDSINGTTPLATTVDLVDGQQYWSSMTDPTSACESATRLEVTVTITVIPPPTIGDVTVTFCEIDAATVADLSSDSNITWYDTINGTTPLATTVALVDGQQYWSSITEPTSACESATRLEVTTTIIVIPPPTTADVTIAFCEIDAATVADLSSDPNISWYDTIDGTTPLAGTDALVDGQLYWSSMTEPTSTCESANRLEVTVTIEQMPEAGTDGNYTTCETDMVSTDLFTLLGDNPDATGTWTSPDANPLTNGHLGTFDPTVNISGIYTYSVTNSSNVLCPLTTVTATVTVSIIQVAPPTISDLAQTFCASDSPMISDISVSSSSLIWYDSSSSTTALSPSDILANGDYFAAESDGSSGCQSIVREMVTITLTDPGTPTISSLGNEFCKIENPTVSDLDDKVSSANGGSITWYDNFPNGNEMFLSDALEEGATYYAVESDNSNCESVTPLQVTVTLEACDEYDITVYDGFSPTGDGTNDTFKITNLRALYPNFKTEFFNRWGSTVYTGDSNKPDWDGRLNGDGELAPAGVYYVVIHFNEDNRKPIQKRLYLSR